MSSIRLQKCSTIQEITDGTLLELPRLRFRTPNIFTSMAFTDFLVVKLPAFDMIDNFERVVLRKGASLRTLRKATDTERNAQELLERFPEFGALHERNAYYCHLLMIQRLQLDTLKSYDEIRIPESRFVFVHVPRFFSWKLSPAVIQERVTATSLLKMVTKREDGIRTEWIPHLPEINAKLRALLVAERREQLNWYITNFLYNHTDGLWYVDLKPSCLFGRASNDQNINAIREVFFQYT